MSCNKIPMEPAPELVTFQYLNHRGEVRQVRIDAATSHLWAGVTEHYPEHQPLLTAWDLDRGEERTYALRRVLGWGEV